ncbi:MAG: hypothetical protein K0U45_01535 [Alphaproteobacteria bacterium]|nr:hypothetical protein [Alphaproteobacteria bacterium]
MRKLSQKESAILSLAICVVLISIIYLPSLLFFSFMLLPTVFLIYYDTDSEYTKAKAIGSLNVVGVAHAIGYSLDTYGTFDNLRIILRDPTNWFYPIGLSLLGLIIFRILPFVIRNWTEFWLDRKESILKERQTYLISEWGNKVKGNLNSDLEYEYDFIKDKK